MTRAYFKVPAKSPKTGRTANGMPTFTASGDALVDLFASIGASRGKDVTKQFEAAYVADREKALKILLWARDVRGGAGERQTFRNLMRTLEATHPEDVEMLIPYVPFFGRWDDLLVFQTEQLKQAAYSVISEGLEDPSTRGICSKWMPRKGSIALELEAFLGLRPTTRNFDYASGGKAYPARAYRQLLSSLSNTVEQKLCAKQFDEINFNHVPSLAAARYQKAFNKRCAERYAAYKAGLAKGTTKVNASAVYPYDVIKSIDHGDKMVAKAQWEALPNYMGNESILPMIDVSGSMTVPSGAGNVSNLQVACSLGLYVADKNKGAFKDVFLTFSGSPRIEVLAGDILQKYAQMKRADWMMNTNLMGAMQEILRVGTHNKVADEDMPKMLLILSDMEFDACVNGSDKRAMEATADLYDKAGYTMPRVVFWNIATRPGNSPVRFNEQGTALVSGFSPAIMKSILAAQEIKSEEFTPRAVMEKTISNPRYDVIDKGRTTVRLPDTERHANRTSKKKTASM